MIVRCDGVYEHAIVCYQGSTPVHLAHAHLTHISRILGNNVIPAVSFIAFHKQPDLFVFDYLII